MASDCTALLMAMKLPRTAGLADAPTNAMPGIMRPLSTTNITMLSAITQGNATGGRCVNTCKGNTTKAAKAVNTRTLPCRSLSRPIQRALNKVAAPPNK